MVPTITMPETKLFDENDFYNRHEKPSEHSVAGVPFSRQALSPCGLLRGGFFHVSISNCGIDQTRQHLRYRLKERK